jgi:peptidoglycan/LPS O-acetylase OafA/YrhL
MLLGLYAALVALHPPLGNTAEAVVLSLLLASTLLHPGGPIGRLLESSIPRQIGRLSYSLYLWQQVCLPPLSNVGTVYAWQRLPLNVCVAFGLAWASYHLVERPMVRLGHRLAPPVTPGRPPGSSEFQSAVDQVVVPTAG